MVARLKSGSFKPAPREADFGPDEALPRIAIGLDLQFADRWVRHSRFNRTVVKHNSSYPMD
jgi:hypothetical protein